MIINLLSCPRNVSTAFMYSFAQREDTKVLDEPFYAYYLSIIGPENHPGGEETMSSMSSDFSTVIDQIQEEHEQGKNVFIKNMTHHMIQCDLDFMLAYKNIMFIRHPGAIIASFSKVIEHPIMRDIGVEQQSEMHQTLTKNGKAPIVLDSAELLKNPEVVLSKLCDELGIPFDKKMLSWKKGARPEDGIWAKYWYSNVQNSTGFGKPKTEEPIVPDHLKELYEEAMPHYLELRKHSLTAD